MTSGGQFTLLQASLPERGLWMAVADEAQALDLIADDANQSRGGCRGPYLIGN